jgi:hypothetical protein
MPTPGVPSLKAALESALSDNNQTAAEAAQKLAEAIDAHVKNSTVTGTVTSGAGAGGTIAGVLT